LLSRNLGLGGNLCFLLSGGNLGGGLGFNSTTAGVASLLNDGELFGVFSNVLEEAFLEFVKVLIQLLGLLFNDRVILLVRFLELCLLLGLLEILLSLELSFENGGHDFLLLGLKGLIIE
jgi:hypothetical protein